MAAEPGEINPAREGSLPFQHISHRGTCGKAGCMAQNIRPKARTCENVWFARYARTT